MKLGFIFHSDFAYKDFAESLVQYFGQDVCKNWFYQLSLKKNDNSDECTLCAPTRFIKDWVQIYYLEKIKELAVEHNIVIDSFELSELVEKSLSDAENLDENNLNLSDINHKNSLSNADKSAAADSIIYSSNLNPKYNFDSFVIGKSNEFAYAAARRVAEEDNVYNPLFLCGSVGMGKTHLMHAIGLYAIQHRNKRVLYATAETFMYEFVNAIRHQTVMDFKKMFRSVDILMIDDIQFIADKGSTQEELFHTWNSLMEQRKQVIVSADKFPSEINGIPDRMRSRLGSGLVAVVHEADYELRFAVLQQKANEAQKNFGVAIENGVLEALAESVISNIRELEGVFITILAKNRDGIISLEHTKNVLYERYPVNTKFMNVDDIRSIVAEYYNIKLADMNAKIRTKDIAKARQIAMFLTKTMTVMSLPSIGKKFGGRDHTTVMHAVKSVNEMIENNLDNIQEDIKILKKKIMQNG